MAKKVSLWATAAVQQLLQPDTDVLHNYTAGDLQFELKTLGDTLWVITNLAGKSQLAFRVAYSPNGFDEVKVGDATENGINISLKSAVGDYKVNVSWPESAQPVLHYTTTLKPAENLAVPFWPRDIIAFGKREPQGEIHISQTGTRSGLIYAAFKKPAQGSFLYLQNLTALADYNQDTETSAGETVGGEWPEMGLSLPPAIEKPLQQGKTYVLTDAFVAFSNETPADQFEVSKGFLEALGNLYLLLPRPDTAYRDYLEAMPKTLNDIETNKGCWSHRSGHPYLNAYLCDYDTPPEIMVQLAVLLPVQEYMRWSGETSAIDKDITDGLAAFYNKELGTVMRWLPSEEHRLDKSEEQKTPLVMDSWYLHHPLLNLARMVEFGNKLAKELLLNSIDYAIKVARYFNYCWPVFYKMDTLEVVKAETKPGEGGEKDVAGLYAHVMLQVWELTKDDKYFKEAERAAQSMVQHGFDVLYQANNTMFSAKAMILLYKETKKELYRDLAYLFLANIFKNVALWECEYGFGKNFPTFFELFPLSDAPYTAVYEEQESYAGVHEFLTYAQGIEFIPAVRLLLAEFVRYAINRMIFYYPPLLPDEMLAKEIKTGELDPKVWIALEDIHDGWERSGGVGQEVYGAGLAFGILPRQYFKIPDQEFLVFIDYPALNAKFNKNKLSFDVVGDERLSCRLQIINKGKAKLPSVAVQAGQKKIADIEPLTKQKDMIEYRIQGNQKVTISWK